MCDIGVLTVIMQKTVRIESGKTSDDSSRELQYSCVFDEPPTRKHVNSFIHTVLKCS